MIGRKLSERTSRVYLTCIHRHGFLFPSYWLGVESFLGMDTNSYRVLSVCSYLGG
jgi:hypothetical protein